MKADTILQHLGEEVHYAGAVTPPIFQTSLFVHDDLAGLRTLLNDPCDGQESYVYSRVGNPNLTMAEKKLAALEGTEAALLFNSGMAAISAAILCSVKSGDHVVCIETAYGPSCSFLRDYLPKFGVTTTFVNGDCLDEIKAACRPETTFMLLESPSSILFRLQNLRAITDFAKSRGIRTAIDNSYHSPILQNPARLGVDIVLHSATKFISGHSDVVAGAFCASKEICNEVTNREGQWLGGRLGPFEAWLLLRGMRTMRLRVEESVRQGERLFAYLQTRPEIAEIYHAGDPSGSHYEVAKTQCKGFVSLMSFRPKVQDPDKIAKFCESLELFGLGVSWGGFESLVIPIHGKPSDWETEQWVIRLYIGLEDFDDLRADLDRAFAHLA